MQKAIIRAAAPDDIGTITRVYADAVLNGTASFEIKPPDQAEMLRRQTALLKNGYPYFAAEVEGSVAGYAYAGPYRSRPVLLLERRRFGLRRTRHASQGNRCAL